MEMTDKQFYEERKTLILLIIEMIKNSKDLAELEEKVKALLPKE